MDTNKAEGAVQEVAGKVQDAVGGVVGDVATQMSGKARELRGKAQQLCADTTSIVRDRTTESPFAALGVVAIVGFIAGVMWANGKSDSSSRTYPRNLRTDDREC